ncbi:MAG: 50S ribosomal protein L28 [Candidatus Woesebacteria bacterium GW2011_GWB1_43_14]|uniref:Large ribosomal subunit protein bL28 n=1 Tax=Candidatus Woesebacteria bacterium GW2011_GWB1_43_14 TaxID=1618578 RepID=A0A0G1DH68_9BACT|nr:MAG: 50S ribosomal protein L28 [Candidatus Woesebacteria bacterium GW2011_GWA1_39_11b]KKS77755.1 MAG: L28p-like protein [Candidatus Woesebacteria bacterium GW2011_GWC1_42_9]KKS96937.1 MAG: 50S ribosomal protein L28 [Candidatus Woesebacteria bacterium GW2011_GWB1_43_14]
MARVCEICGKSTGIGASQKHRRGVAGKRWKNRVAKTPRVFIPNLQMATIVVDGRKKRVRICAKCLKRRKKNQDSLL